MNSKSPSIAAIIFVTIYFLVVVFISLFKGLTFHNIKLNNLYIKKAFIKINKKLIFRANSITIKQTQKINKDITTIHQKIYYLSKISTLFELLEFTDIKYKKVKIPLIKYNNSILKVFTNNFLLYGKILSYKNNTIIQNFNIRYDNTYISNINGLISYNKNINFKLNWFYNHNKITLDGTLDQNDTLSLNINAKNFKTNFKNIKTNIKNLSVLIKYQLKYSLFQIKTKFDYLKTLYKNIEFNGNNGKIDINNKKIKLELETLKIPKISLLKNINLNYLKATYFIKEKILVANNNHLSFLYKNYNIKANDNNLIFKNKNNLNFCSKKVSLFFKDYLVTGENGIFSKYNNFIYFQVSNNHLKNKLLKIYNDIIYFYKNRIEITNIKGNYKNINFKISNSLINPTSKKAVITDLNINDIKFSPIFINYEKEKLTLKTISNNIQINKTLKNTLKDFNISLPITQLKGKNKVKASLSYFINKKSLSWNIDINSTNSIFQYKNYLFSYKSLNSNIKDYNSTTIIKSFYIPFEYGKLKANAKIKTNKNFINTFIFIKKLNIANLLDINSYKEKIAINLDDMFIYFINSNIIADLKNKIFFILSIKNIIDYTPFNKIIKDGNINIKISKNAVSIKGNILLTKPLIMNQKKPDSLNAEINIKNNNVTIENKFIIANIENLTNININLSNVILNAKTLIFIYKNLNNLFKNKSKTTNTSLTINALNSSFIYDLHKFLSQEAKITYNKNLKIFSKYKNSSLKGYSKRKYFLMEGKNYQKEELVALLDFFNNFKNINLDFVFVKSPDDFYTGKIYIKKGIVKELVVLNNIIAFLNTIPSLLSISSPGFSAKGYKIKKGYIDYLYYNDILYLKQIKIIGANIDFIGKGYIDFNKKFINLKLTANLKIKIKKIPIIGKGLSYILFGKDGSINVKIIVKGDVDNPKVSQDIGKNILLTPFELFKRAITLPFNIF